jgi:hypothetical protein
MYLRTRHSFALSVPYHAQKPMTHGRTSIGLIGTTVTDSTIWSRVGHTRSPKRIRTCSTLDPKPRTSSHIIGAFPRDSIHAAHSCTSTDSSESRIKSVTCRDALPEKVRNENPLLTAENPLRPFPATSCSTRNIIMSAFIRAFDPPSDRGRSTSIRTTAFGGGQVAEKTNAPATLMSRVDPSPW